MKNIITINKLRHFFNIEFICGCGIKNYSLEDWKCHFKYRGFKRGLRHLLFTKIVRGV